MPLNTKALTLFVSVALILVSSSLLVLLLRLASVLGRPKPKTTITSKHDPAHLLVVLGSGGHTAEMLNILSSITDIAVRFTHRTYLVSSGDVFSAQKAQDFERELNTSTKSCSIVTVRRARKVHQSFFTTPFTALISLWDCIRVLQGRHADFHGISKPPPDLILTNGPGTGVCVVTASIILLILEGDRCKDQMRSIFIESWARVRTLSLSGKILKGLVNRFLVQWPQLSEDGVEYIGPMVS